MNGSIIQQEGFYRRGLVLGLTMAEVIVLIIFCLLLALSVMFPAKDKEIKEAKKNTTILQQELEANKEQIKNLEEKIDVLVGMDESARNNFDDLFRELEIAKSESARLNERIIALQEKQKRASEFEEILKTCGFDTSDKDKFKSELMRSAKAHKIIIQVADESENETAGLADEIIEQLNERQELHRMISTLKGQLKNMQVKMSGLGRGTEMPPCWADQNTGKPEYIFDIALTSSGLVLLDRELQHRREDQAKLPINGIKFREEITADTFLSECDPIYQWSRQNDCRFFVRVFDLTKHDEKEIYKSQLRVVEQRFYKYEVVNESFPISIVSRN